MKTKTPSCLPKNNPNTIPNGTLSSKDPKIILQVKLQHLQTQTMALFQKQHMGLLHVQF